MEIGEAENTGAKYLARLSHERFTMRKPNGELATKPEFIAPAHRCRARDRRRINPCGGQFMATASSSPANVTWPASEKVVYFDNLRFFVFTDDRWQLLSWFAGPLG